MSSIDAQQHVPSEEPPAAASPDTDNPPSEEPISSTATVSTPSEPDLATSVTPPSVQNELVSTEGDEIVLTKSLDTSDPPADNISETAIETTDNAVSSEVIDSAKSASGDLEVQPVVLDSVEPALELPSEPVSETPTEDPTLQVSSELTEHTESQPEIEASVPVGDEKVTDVDPVEEKIETTVIPDEPVQQPISPDTATGPEDASAIPTPTTDSADVEASAVEETSLSIDSVLPDESPQTVTEPAISAEPVNDVSSPAAMQQEDHSEAVSEEQPSAAFEKEKETVPEISAAEEVPATEESSEPVTDTSDPSPQPLDEPLDSEPVSSAADVEVPETNKITSDEVPADEPTIDFTSSAPSAFDDLIAPPKPDFSFDEPSVQFNSDDAPSSDPISPPESTENQHEPEEIMPENYVESENPFGSTTEASFFDQIATPPVEEKTEEPAPTEKEVATQASFFDQIATPSAEETEESAPAEKEIATGASFFDQIATPPVEEKTEIPAPTEKEVATEASFFDQIATPPVEEKSEEPAPAEEEVETSANPFTASEPSFFDEISTSTAKAPDAESTPAVGDTTLESSQVVPEAAPAEPVLSFPASGPSIFDNLGSSEATVEQKDSEEAGPSLSFENEPETSFFDQIGASEQNDSGEIHFDSAGATDDFLSSITPAAPTESSAPAHKDIEIVAEDSFDFLLEDDDFLSDEEPAPAPAATTKAPVQGRTSSYIPAAAVPSQPTSNYGGSVYNPAPYAASATGSITGASQTSQDAYKPKPFFSELPTLPQPKLMRRIEQYEQHAINHTTYAPPPPGPAANYMSNTPPPPGPAANYMSSTPPPAIIRSPPNQYAAPYTSPQQQQLLPAINPYAPVSSTAPSQVPQASYGSPQPAAAVPINPYAPMTTVSSPIKTAQKSINAFIPSPGTAFATLAPAETSQSNAYPAPANYTSPPPPAQSNYAPTVNNPYTPVATNAYAPSPSNAYAPSQPSMPAAAPVNNSYGAQQPPGGQYYGQPQAPPVAPPKTQPPRSQINSRGTDAYDPPFLPSTYAPPKRTVSQTWASNAPRASQAPPQGRPTPPPPRSNYSPQPENRQPAYPGMQSQQPAYTQGAPSQQYPPPPTGAYRPSSAVPPVQSTPPPMQHIPTAVQSTPPSVYGQAAASQHAPSGLSRASSYAPYSPPQNNNSQQSAAYLQTSPGSSFNGAKRSHTPRPNRSARPEPHPLVSWGANGRIATIFPTQNPQMAYTSTELDFTHSTIKMHNAKDVITDRAHDLVYTKFPGPLFHVASKSTNKSKKKEAAKWMESKIEELSKLVYDAVGADAKHEAEDKVSLWKCVKILLEHDYRFANNAEAIKEIRTALVPESADDSQVDEVGHFSSATDLYQRHVRNASSGSVEASGSVDTAKKIQALQKIRESLLKGNREAALMYSLDNKMWGHALLISNTISKERWTEAVHEFVQTEIKGIQTSEASSLAVVYNVFAGAGGEAVDSLLPPGMTVDLLPTASTRDQVPQDLLKWRETLAMIISNSSPPNDLDAILKLGTALERYGMTYAAHTCYIFTSAVFGAVDDPAASYTLLGADFSRNPSSFSKDLDAIVLSEIYELMVSQSDQVPAGTIYPHLQLFKYQHALMLSESGLVAEAKKYCEQILAGVKATPKTSFMYNSEFLVSVRELAARLSGVPDAEGKWLGGLVSKPTFGNMWGNIDKKLAQFVAGDDENASGNATASNKEGTDERFQKLASSPTLSRNQSVADLSAMGQSYYNNTGGAHSPSANASGMYNPRSHGSSPSSHRGNTSYSNYQDGYASDYPPVRPHSNPYAPRQESPNPYAPSTAAVDIPRSNYSQNAYEPTGSSYDSQPRMQPDYSRPGSAYSYRPASSQGGRSSALAPLTAVKPAENYSKPPTPASGTQGPPSRPAFQSRRSSYDSNNAYDPTRASSGYEPPKPTYEAPENDEYSELNHRSGYGDDELSGYPSYGEEATTEDRNESYDPEGGVSSGYQPPEMTYEPPTPTYEPEAETEEQAEEEPSPKMPEMPSYGYGYEPPSYEPMIGGPVMGDYGSSSYEPPEQEPESGGYNGGYMPPDPEDNAGDYENGHGGHNGNNDRYDDGFDDDDLGIGNSSLRKKKAPKDDGEQKEEKEDKKEEEKKEEKNDEHAGAAKSGWLSGWLRRSKEPADNKPKPIRAKLGEEIKFVYDEKQKRWVNPNDPDAGKPPAPPPPPPGRKPAPASSTPGPSTPSLHPAGPPGGSSKLPPTTSASLPPSNAGTPPITGGGLPPPPPPGSAPPLRGSSASLTGLPELPTVTGGHKGAKKRPRYIPPPAP